jgi:hypothetical protein
LNEIVVHLLVLCNKERTIKFDWFDKLTIYIGLLAFIVRASAIRVHPEDM